MPFEIPSVEELISQADALHVQEFGDLPDLVACAPGRVNLIGEHTDYNDGYVLPIALPMITIVAGSFETNGQCIIVTSMNDSEDEKKVKFNAKGALPGKPKWANYVKGVVNNFPGTVPGFTAVIVSSVPPGSGLSSSAALEVATFTFLEGLTGNHSAKLTEKTLLCQKAEHEYAGVPCGIMDQFASIFGAHRKAMLIDCRSMEYQLVPFDDPDLVILITNSNVKHDLSASEYPVRRRECNEVAGILGKTSLRDATLEELMSSEGNMPNLLFRRGKHVITEIARTKEAAEALTSNNFVRFGQLMYESHDSLRDDFEVSCSEIDLLVKLILEFEDQHNDSVLGCRMTGAGFGGSIVTLVRKEFVNSLADHVKKRYQIGSPSFYSVKPSYGARILRTAF